MRDARRRLLGLGIVLLTATASAAQAPPADALEGLPDTTRQFHDALIERLAEIDRSELRCEPLPVGAQVVIDSTGTPTIAFGDVPSQPMRVVETPDRAWRIVLGGSIIGSSGDEILLARKRDTAGAVLDANGGLRPITLPDGATRAVRADGWYVFAGRRDRALYAVGATPPERLLPLEPYRSVDRVVLDGELLLTLREPGAVRVGRAAGGAYEETIHRTNQIDQRVTYVWLQMADDGDHFIVGESVLRLSALAEKTTREPNAPATVIDGYTLGTVLRTTRIDPRRMLLTVECKRDDQTWGHAVLDAAGVVTPISVEGDGVEFVDAFVEEDGSVLLATNGRGIGRLDGSAFAWLHQDWPTTGVADILGRDRAGRLLLERHGQVFVWRADGRVPADVAFTSVPIWPRSRTDACVMDDQGSVWFVAAALPAGDDRPPAEVDRDDVRPALYSVGEDGSVRRFASDASLSKALILPGSDGAVFVRAAKAYLFHDGKGVAAGSLHELARELGTTMYDAAAVWAPSASLVYTTVVRVGPCVMVYDDELLELYRDGKAHGIAGRITDLVGPYDSARVVGSFADAAGEHVLVSVRNGREREARHLWLHWTKATDAITLDVIEPGNQDGMKGLRVYLDEAVQRDAQHRLAIFDNRHTGDKLVVNGPSRYEILDARGTIVTVGPDGTIATLRRELTMPQVMMRLSLVHNGTARIVDRSWLDGVEPMAIDDDGSVICSSWDGLVWLRPNDDGVWTPSDRVRLAPHGRPTRWIGTTPTAIYVIKGRNLVRIPRPAPTP